MQKQNPATDVFIKLVQIDSPSGHEEKMAQYLTAWLKKMRFDVKQDKTGNIYGTNNKPGATLLLCSHMDTVDPGENIKPVVEKGIIKSSGDTILGSDNKSAVAAIMTAVEENNSRNLELLFTVKEETGGGVEFFPFEWIKSKTALVFDSSLPLGGIILRSPYITSFHVTITGKASHASRPEEGINAFLPAFTAFPAIPLGSLDNRETTVNIGKILGGTGINTIPAKIEIKGEVRSYNKTYFNARLENIKSIFQAAAVTSNTQYEFKTDGFCPGYAHDGQDETVKKIDAVYKQLGLKTVLHNYAGVSDANILNNKGIKTINLTFGGKFAHTVNEQITVEDQEKLKDIVKACTDKL